MKDISGFGDNYPSAIGPAPTEFQLVTTKPAHLMVTWGANPQTPQGPGEGVNIAATLTGPGGSWTGKGNQNGGSVTNDPGTAKAPAGTYVLTLVPTSSDNAKQGQPAPTNVIVHNACSIPR